MGGGRTRKALGSCCLRLHWRLCYQSPSTTAAANPANQNPSPPSPRRRCPLAPALMRLSQHASNRTNSSRHMLRQARGATAAPLPRPNASVLASRPPPPPPPRESSWHARKARQSGSTTPQQRRALSPAAAAPGPARSRSCAGRSAPALTCTCRWCSGRGHERLWGLESVAGAALALVSKPQNHIIKRGVGSTPSIANSAAPGCFVPRAPRDAPNARTSAAPDPFQSPSHPSQAHITP